jgi:Mrp family chromosome partitioning ATPase/capsular polysaccharide biosynthesis protein
MTDRPDPNRSWLQPPEEAVGLRVYMETLRERIKLILAITLIATAIAILYVLTASKVYESQAEMLITPVSSSDPVLATLGLITDSSEPTRPIETASKFVTNIDVAELVKKELKSEETAEALLGKISAEPVAQSNVVAVTAKANSPEYATELANAFANAAVVDRTKRLHERIETTIPQLEAQIATTPTGTGTAGESLGAELALLQTLQNGPDPTIAVDAEAAAPGSQVWPRTVLSVVGGIFAGLIIGIAAAFAAQALDPRLRREEQLRRSYRLPILTRVPRDPSGRAEGRPLNPRTIEPITTEAYRTLRATFLTRRPTADGRGRIILVTGSSVAEGKTSTAVNLATSLALANKRVILVDSDLRRPSLAAALDLETDGNGVVSTLLGNSSLDEALVTLPDYGTNLRVLPADNEGGWIAELFSIPAAEEMLRQAAEMADFVIIDSAPLTEVVDALPLARQADDVLIVVRLGRTRLDSLQRLTEMLAENEIKPAGFAIVNARRPGTNYDYHEKTGVSAGRRSGTGLRRVRSS